MNVISEILKKVAIVAILIAFSQCSFAQEGESIEHEETDKNRRRYEIITSGVYAYAFKHKVGEFGTEVHLTYWLSHKWGAGLLYTYKFDEHNRINEFALLGSMNPTEWMTINVGPNFTFRKPKNHGKLELSIGAYTELEFNIRPTEWFHFGPVLGTVISNDSELIFGLHVGFEF